MMNNWHIKIEDCTEAQKERLKRVYGDLPININTYLGLHNGIVIGVFGPDGMGELITPEQAFERLGLDVADNDQSYALKYDLHDAEQKIKELEQQLAAKPELQGIDWTLINSDFTHLVQDKETGKMQFCRARYYSDCIECFHLIATRPKPKYTPEQIEAVKDFDAWVSRRHKLSGEFNWWLKEVGND